MQKKNIVYLVSIFLISLLLFSLYKKDNAIYEKILFSEKISVKNIEIYGYNNLELNDIKNYFNEEETKGKNLFFLQPKIIQKKILSNPLIYNAEVTKRYPDKLFINIEEKQPILLILDNKKKYMFDSNDEITEIDDEFMSRYSIFDSLLKAEGSNTTKEAKEISEIFVQKDFTKRISGLYKIGNRRFDMIVDRKIKIMLPEKINKDQIIDVFNLIDKLKANNDLHKDAVYSIVDLRVNKRIFIKNINE